MVTAEHLLVGPRGRRMLLEYASISDQTGKEEFDHNSFLAALFTASHNLDPGRGTSRVRLSLGGDEEAPDITAEETARRLASVRLLEVTPELLRFALAGSVDNSRPFQEPDGEDVLGATEPMRSELRRVAEKIVASPYSSWWADPFRPDDQWSIQWIHEQFQNELSMPPRSLAVWRAEILASEARAQRERPDDPAANWSGAWWSIPETTLPHSNRLMSDGTPAGLWFVEDSMGFERAIVKRLLVPDDVDVYEIDSAEAWAELCRRYPLDVSYEKKHDWYRSTGRAGRWVIPDWSLVAEDYDGVHLTGAAYLSAVSTAIPVSEDTASVIAGWNPDETWWLTDVVSFGESKNWVLETLPDYSRHWVQV